MVISMLKIRRPLGRLIFNMGIAIPGKTIFLIETAPWSCFYSVFVICVYIREAIIHSSPKVMAVFVQYWNVHVNFFGSLWFLICKYLGSLDVLIVKLIEIGRIFIACEASKLGYEKSSLRPSKFTVAFKYTDLFKLKNETSVSNEIPSGIQ